MEMAVETAPVVLTGEQLTLREIGRVSYERANVQLGPDAIQRMSASRRVVEGIVDREETVYGVNTGFGKLSDIHIPAGELRQLQKNLVRSHAAGVGEPLSVEETRAMLLLRANVLAKGFSGARPLVAELLIAMLNAGINPVIPAHGSVGASGDLAPLAHLALALIGEGDVVCDGSRMAAAKAIAMHGLAPITLEAKEGLALLNGTQAMAAVGGLAIVRALRVAALFDLSGAMTLEALRGTPVAFDPRIHAARPHPGQKKVAAHLLALLADSEIRESHRTGDSRIQDAYCLRCIPQVHGAARGALAHVQHVIEVETGSATDNPLVFVDTGEIISGGNFHGAPLALGLDYAAIAMTDLMSIAERRVDRLVNPDINEGLPAFLSDSAGVSSGFMIVHVTAAALLNEAKVLAHPASTDSVPTSGGKEDHVSMGMTSALKLKRIVENAEHVLAIEMMAAAQGLEYRRPLHAATEVERAYRVIRDSVPRLGEDRSLAAEIELLARKIREGAFDEWC